MTGWRYLVDKDVVSGTVALRFPDSPGDTGFVTGREWVDTFEKALQTGRPRWWDIKTQTQITENLVLLKFPKRKLVLVLRKDKARRYR